MTRFWFGLAAVLLMGLYSAMVNAATAHVVGFELPAIVYFLIASLAPVVILLANALPSLFLMLPGASGTIPVPTANPVQASLQAAHEALAPEPEGPVHSA